MKESTFELYDSGEWKNYKVARRPETPEDALHLMQALYDIGMQFHANEPDKQAALDANPMLETLP